MRFLSRRPFVVAVFSSALFLVLRHPVSEFVFERGLHVKKAWQLDRAIRHFQWSLRLHSGFEYARYEKGICHQLQGDFLSSQREFDLLLAGGTKDQRLAARLWNAVGINRFHSNQSEAAIRFHERSLHLARNLGDRHSEAEALIHLSRVLYYSKGQPARALECLQGALQIGRELGEELLKADTLRNLGVLSWWFQGDFQQALAYYEQALHIYKRHNDLRSAAITLSNIGLLYQDQGELLQFLKYQQESLKIKQQIGDLGGLSDSYVFLASIYGDKKAYEYYSKSLQISMQTGNVLTRNEVENRLAGIYLRAGNYDKAIELLQRLLKREAKNPLSAKYRIASLATCYLLKGDPESARQYVRRALEIHRIAHDSSLFEIGELLELARASMDLGEFDEASRALSHAVELLSPQENQWWIAGVWIHMTTAELREREGRRQEALQSVLRAAEVESNVYGTEEPQLIPGQEKRIYDRLFALLLEQKESADAERMAFHFLEQLRYRSFRNLVVRLSEKQREAESRSQQELEALARIEKIARRLKKEEDSSLREQLRRAYSEYEDLVLETTLDDVRYRMVRQARPATLEAVQKSLEDQTALIEYLFAGNQVYALLITRSSVQSVLLPVETTNLAAKVKLFRSQVFESGESVDWRLVGEDLYKILFEPLDKSGLLSDIRRIGIIPYAFLHDLPFAALLRGNGTFLIEEYTLFYIPSATYITQSSHNRERAPLRMISFATGVSDEPELLPLRFAEEEARSVARIWKGQIRLNSEATETEFKKLASHFQYIHVATHAVSEPQMPLLSRLKLQGNRYDDGNLTVREILQLGLRCDLVTLGGCRTGQNYSSGGQETSELDRIGLIEAFLYSGAKSILASLLPLSDQPTTEFMKTFYQELQSSEKADALAKTQRAMLWGKFSHPRCWAPFILVGDYR